MDVLDVQLLGLSGGSLAWECEFPDLPNTSGFQPVLFKVLNELLDATFLSKFTTKFFVGYNLNSTPTWIGNRMTIF